MAGFIGYHTAKHFYDNGFDVVGIDNLQDDVQIKRHRLAEIPGIMFYETDILDMENLYSIFDEHSDAQYVVHLAAAVGVRESFNKPQTYILQNMVGFQNILDVSHELLDDPHIIYASSSSVYGDVDIPKSIYGITKLSNELQAHIYSTTYGIKTTGLRFFTVYGPWMRPDLAISQFTKSLLADKPLTLFNMGENSRDYTYIDDAVSGIELAMMREFDVDDDNYTVYDIGTGESTTTLDLVSKLEYITTKTAKKWLEVAQNGDAVATCAIIDEAEDEIGYTSVTTLDEGLRKFYDWYVLYESNSLASN